MKYLSLTNIQHFLDKIKTFVLDKINAIPDPMHYAGTWNAATNTPALSATDTAKSGHVYRVSAAGTQFGLTFKQGDRLVYNESGHAEKWDTTDEVWSVNGKTGDVVLMSINSPVLNHAAIYVGNDMILHHLHGRLSRREPACLWRKMFRRWIRHEDGNTARTA